MWETQWTKTPYSQCTGIPVKRSGFNTWPGRYVVFLDKTLHSHSVSLHPECKWVPANFQGSLVKCWGVTMRWTSIPSRGGEGEGVVTLLIATYYENRDKLRLDGPVGSSTDFILLIFTKIIWKDIVSFIQGRYTMCTEFRDLMEGTRTVRHVVHNQQSARNDGDIDNRAWYRFVSQATGTPVQVWSKVTIFSG